MSSAPRTKEKPTNSVYRLYEIQKKRVRILSRKQTREETKEGKKKVSQSEIVRRAIDLYYDLFPSIADIRKMYEQSAS